MKKIHKALTFRASSIGDCLMGKHLLENIYAQHPNARLGIVVASRGAMIRDLFAAYPWLEVVEANRRNPRALFSLLRNFFRSDLVITQYAGKKGGRFGFASKLAARLLAKRGGLIGFNDASQWNGYLYDRLLPVRSDKAVAEHDHAVLRAEGIPISSLFPTLKFIKDDSVLTKFGLEKEKYIIVHLFAGNMSRGLHPDQKREILLALAKKFPNIHLVVSGGIADKEEALRVAGNIPVKVIAGDATLQEMMNLIDQSRGVVSVDTGMAHIAAQLRKPLVVMRTCLGANWWFHEQYGDKAPITILSCDEGCVGGHIAKNYPDCINEIPNEAILRAVA